MLKGKTVVLGITGSIAAYKIAYLASMLVKLECEVYVVMTAHAQHFINPITFETLTGHKCLTDTFDRNFEFHVAHVSLAQKADIILIAPASANILGKIASGIADDMLTTMVLAAKCPIIVAPAMNTAMYRNVFVQDNVRKLKNFGIKVIEPTVGRLACASVGEGKLPDESVLLDYIRKEIAYTKDLEGLKIVVTAGPTRETIDPIRFITNHSSGKMGYAISRAAVERGANVTLISGTVSLPKPLFLNSVDVNSAEQMFEAVKNELENCDVLIMSAAVADFTPILNSDEKIKKSCHQNMNLLLKPTTDILKYAGERKCKGQLICGFSMETNNLLENSIRKLKEKHADMIVANNINVEGAGFGIDTNVVTIITKETTKDFPLMTKEELSHKILDELLSMIKK